MKQWDDKPEFQIHTMPHLYEILGTPIEHRNRKLLEWVYYMLMKDVPGPIVAELMSSLFWSFDNALAVARYSEKLDNSEKTTYIDETISEENEV
jgi:hypothetical protein